MASDGLPTTCCALSLVLHRPSNIRVGWDLSFHSNKTPRPFFNKGFVSWINIAKIQHQITR
jgi:hypothetical protein